MSGVRLGVDYGSSHTVAVLSWPDGRTRPLLFDGSPLLPSAVHADGGERLLMGADAERAARAEPARAEPNPKRRFTDGAVLLGGDEYPVSRLVAATLRAVADEATRAAGRAPDAVTLTYPAAWGRVRLGVLREAAESAGLAGARFVPEPVAAANFIAVQPDAAVVIGECVVVYDLGAGTCDVAVVRRGESGFTVVADGGLDDAGGLDLDKIVVDVIAETEPEARPASDSELRHRRALWLEARHAKESLSRRSSVNVHVPMVDRTVLVTREQFDAAARSLLTRTADVTTRVIEQSGVDEQRIKGLFLVGGASRVPLVATVLHRATGLAPVLLDQPELVVAEGSLHVGQPQPPASAGPSPAATPPTGAEPAVTPPTATAATPAAEPPLDAEQSATVTPPPAAESPVTPPPAAAQPGPAAEPETTPPAAVERSEPRTPPPPLAPDPAPAAAQGRPNARSATAPAVFTMEREGATGRERARGWIWGTIAVLVIGFVVAAAGGISAMEGAPEKEPGENGAFILLGGLAVIGSIISLVAAVKTWRKLRPTLRLDATSITVANAGKQVSFPWAEVTKVTIGRVYVYLHVPAASKHDAELASQLAADRSVWKPESPRVIIAKLDDLTTSRQQLFDALRDLSGRDIKWPS